MGAILQMVVENHEKLCRDMDAYGPALELADSKRWAEAAKRGSIFFYREQEVQIGRANIDWSGAHIKHSEWPAQLNRFFCLPYLCNVHKAEKDSVLPRLSREMIADWISQHDYGRDKPLAKGDNTLNLSIRLGQSTGWGWWPAVARFNCPEAFDEAFLKSMVDSCRGQLEYLRAHMTESRNWRISQLDTMLTCALVLPGQLDEHLQFAVRGLNEAFHRQIHADGSHVEHNPSYHAWMCDVFTHYWYLAEARPGLGLAFDRERVARMWDYRMFSTAPDGGSFGLHDSATWQKPASSQSGKNDLELTREERRKVLLKAGLSSPEWNEEAQPSRAFLSAGQVYLRSDMTDKAEMLCFDATAWGDGHCHLSRNSVNLYSGGRMLLTDPGIFSYEMSDPLMAYGKSTIAHNTLNVELMNQSECNPIMDNVAIMEDAAVVKSVYEGGYFPGRYSWGWYEGKRPGFYSKHTRTLFWLRGRYAVVFDHLQADRHGQMYGIHWQFPIGEAACDPSTGRAWTASAKERNILVQQLNCHEQLRVNISSGDNYAPAGWLPLDVKGGHAPAPQARYHGHTCGNQASAIFLLLPFDSATPPAIKVEKFGNQYGSAEGFIIDWPDGTRDIVAATSQLAAQLGEAGPISTDASLASVTLRHGKPVHTAGCGGMYLEYGGKALVSQNTAAAWSHKLA